MVLHFGIVNLAYDHSVMTLTLMVMVQPRSWGCVMVWEAGARFGEIGWCHDLRALHVTALRMLRRHRKLSAHTSSAHSVTINMIHYDALTASQNAFNVTKSAA